MFDISLPTSVSYDHVDDRTANVTIEPCFPGYGLTLGTALRRVLLSSLQGAAMTEMKIKGSQHEFSTLPHVKEDVVEILMNVKGIRPKLFDTDKTNLKLSVKGKKVVTAGDFEKNASVEIMNPDQVIATLTDDAASLEMDVTIERGLGYIPAEQQEKTEKEIGRIQLDAVFSPVQNVSFSTEHVRVGNMTNYDKIVLGITTDGTISPEEAFEQSAKILVEQFQKLADGATTAAEPEKPEPEEPESTEDVTEEQ